MISGNLFFEIEESNFLEENLVKRTRKVCVCICFRLIAAIYVVPVLFRMYHKSCALIKFVSFVP